MAFALTTINEITDGTLAVDITKSETTPTFALGHRVAGERGSEYVYGKAGEAITGKGYICVFDADYTATMADTTSAAAKKGMKAGGAMTDIAADSFGWFQTKGTGVAFVGSECAAYAALNVTATGGVLDDDATSGSEVIDGIVITSAAASGSGELEIAIYNDPVVGATL